MRRPRIAAAFAAAGRAVERRPAALILTAKFIPVARVAVSMSAGATRFPLRRFLPLVLSAGMLWALYSVGLGLAAGSWLQHNPLLAVVVAIGCALVIGFVVDVIARARAHRRRARETAVLRADAAVLADPANVPDAPNLAVAAGRALAVEPVGAADPAGADASAGPPDTGEFARVD